MEFLPLTTWGTWLDRTLVLSDPTLFSRLILVACSAQLFKNEPTPDHRPFVSTTGAQRPEQSPWTLSALVPFLEDTVRNSPGTFDNKTKRASFLGYSSSRMPPAAGITFARFFFFFFLLKLKASKKRRCSEDQADVGVTRRTEVLVWWNGCKSKNTWTTGFIFFLRGLSDFQKNFQN